MRKSLIHRRPGSRFWWYSFKVEGRRFRGSTGVEAKAEAERIAGRLHAEAVETGQIISQPTLISGRPQLPRRGLTLTQALGAYWLDRGAFAKTADDIERYGKSLEVGLGKDRLVSALSFRLISDYIARRRVRRAKNGRGVLQDRANGSINRELGHLRTVLIHARDNGAEVPRIEWKKLFLPEPDRYETILSVEAEERFFTELRADYWPMVEFALVSGQRLDNVITMRWDQIDRTARTITFRAKSKKPGGQKHVIPLTDRLLQILGPEEGNHPEIVFTYVCERTRHTRTGVDRRDKYRRYPFTPSNWRREWDRARRAVGLPKLRFHDLRHTAGTRMLIAYRDITVVQELLGHADIVTTMRYAKADTSRVREAMEASDTVFARPRRVRLVGSGE
jgi:integrase